MTSLPAALAAAGPLHSGPWAQVPTLAVFPGSTLLGVLFHAGFAALVLWLAVRWARDAAGTGEKAAGSPPSRGGKQP